MTTDDGRRGFDFLFGRWCVANRRLTAFVADCDEWVEFDTTVEARPILGGLGNIDFFSCAGSEAQPPWEASTLRLYEPDADLWRIYWASSLYPGPIGTPVEGRFSDGEGVFFAEEEIGGQRVGVRFLWTHTEDGRNARWEQAFRFTPDGDWQPNWVMELTRSD